MDNINEKRIINLSSKEIIDLLEGNGLESDEHFYYFMLQTVIRSNNPEYLYRIAKIIRPEYHELLVEKIINTNNLYWIFKFIMDIYPYDRLVKFIMKSNNSMFILELALNNIGNIDEQVEKIISIGDVYCMYRMLLDISNIPQNKLVKAILASGNAKYIYLVAKNISDIDMELFVNHIIKTSDYYYIYRFMCDINVEDRLQQLLINKLLKIKDKNNSHLEAIFNNSDDYNNFISTNSLKHNKKIIKKK